VTKSWNQSRPEPKGHGPELPFGAVGRTRGFYNIDKKQPFAGRLKTQAQKSAEGDFLLGFREFSFVPQKARQVIQPRHH
jgi:hypothetical protein